MRIQFVDLTLASADVPSGACCKALPAPTLACKRSDPSTRSQGPPVFKAGPGQTSSAVRTVNPPIANSPKEAL